jgi:hypothetical protein
MADHAAKLGDAAAGVASGIETRADEEHAARQVRIKELEAHHKMASHRHVVIP